MLRGRGRRDDPRDGLSTRVVECVDAWDEHGV